MERLIPHTQAIRSHSRVTPSEPTSATILPLNGEDRIVRSDGRLHACPVKVDAPLDVCRTKLLQRAVRARGAEQEGSRWQLASEVEC